MAETVVYGDLLEHYRRISPEERARLFRDAGHETTSGLEQLLREDMPAFRSIVPQAIDKQTGLFTKEYFEEHLLPEVIAKAKKQNVPLSYLVFDIDKFHGFNEKYSHRAGDVAIEKFAELLSTACRTWIRRQNDSEIMNENRALSERRKNQEMDIVARVNDDGYSKAGRVGYGEEFAVVLYGCDEKAAEVVANKVLDATRKIRVTAEHGEVGFTVSAGIAEYNRNMPIQALKENADKALLYSKSSGRDRVTPSSTLVTHPNL